MAEQAPPDQNAHIDTAAAAYLPLVHVPTMVDGGQVVPTESVPEIEEAAQKLRAAQTGWLERRGVLEDTPHLTMTRRELELLRDVGLGDGADAASHLIDKTRKDYGIPPGAQYASVDIVPDDASLPHATQLVVVQEEDFGTVVDEGRLEGHGIEPKDVPHITMTEREFGLFGIAGLDNGSTSSLIKYARDLCGIPQGDQYAPQYALIDLKTDDPNLPDEPLLVVVNEVDFGTIIDREVIDKDNEYLSPDSDPNSPLTPESGGTYRTVDISNTLTDSWYELKIFASELMKGKTENPLSGRFWLRAGGLAPGQKDAYVWENGTPVKSAVELTIAFPGQYNSVCAVVGERQDAGNGKAGMAQIKDPTVLLTIEGEDLKRLQDVYWQLYHEPDFVLTPEQRSRRDEIFNDYLVGFTSEATRENQAREDDENRRRYEEQRPRYRYHDRP